MALKMYEFKDDTFRYGKPNEFWTTYAEGIGAFIENNKLTPVSKEVMLDRASVAEFVLRGTEEVESASNELMPDRAAGAELILRVQGREDIVLGKAAGAELFVRTQGREDVKLNSIMVGAETVYYPWWFYGGMRGPHLHYKGETYMLTTQQWSEFIEPINADFQNRLANAKGMSFPQMMEFAATMREVI